MNRTHQTSNGYELFRCGACQTILVDAKPPSGEIARVYDELFERGGYEMHRREFSALRSGKAALSLFRQFMIRKIERMAPGKRLVEIGGGSGAFGVLARARGWHYVDYDISDVAVGFARELGLEAHRLEPDRAPEMPPASADVVVMWEVIEHLWEAHSYLRAIRQALRPDGLLLLSTPNLAYQTELEKTGPLSSPPLHVNFFDKASLTETLRRAGFSQASVWPKRFYRPALTLGSLRRSLRWALGLDPPMTLLAVARSGHQ